MKKKLRYLSRNKRRGRSTLVIGRHLNGNKGRKDLHYNQLIGKTAKTKKNKKTKKQNKTKNKKQNWFILKNIRYNTLPVSKLGFYIYI